VESANGHPDFPIQNLPLGLFSRGFLGARPGIAIGDCILDLPLLLATGLLHGQALTAASAAGGDGLIGLLALGAAPRVALRAAISSLLAAGSAHRRRIEACLHLATECTLHLPARIGDYTDFYAGIHHARNVGALFRPDAPLLPNYKHVPIGYHGRASSVQVSGAAIRRPCGQIKPSGEAAPLHAASRRLDFELELGMWIGPGNAAGEAIPIGRAGQHIAGFCLLNDWSARDIQAWEAQPLGPFLAKNFATTISPWIITPEALAPFRVAQNPRPPEDPLPLPYLWDESDQSEGALAIELEASLAPPGQPPHRICLSDTRHLYWTPAQLVAHHASGGCNLRAGDLFGSGTISGPRASAFGSLLELTAGGRTPILLPSGQARQFLEDHDTIILRARARRDGYVTIGFGDCAATVLPAD
jgi:fumarylacetoacetase